MTVGEHEANSVGTILDTARKRLRKRLLNSSFCHAKPDELWVGLCCVYHHQGLHSMKT